MKEIGGYIELERFHGKEYYDGLISLNSGRNALQYLIEAKDIKKLYIPYFLCDSVSKLCDREKCPYEFYRINSNLLPIFDIPLGEGEYIYVVNYYGQISNDELSLLKSKYSNLIFDNVHAFFQPPLNGVDTIYSCRKFFGVPDGAYLSTDKRLDRELETDKSSDRLVHLLGRLEVGASEFYEEFKKNDLLFEALELKYMSVFTKNMMRAIDYKAVERKRNANFSILHEKLGNINKLTLKIPNGPYMYPFYCDNGEDIRRSLAEKNIYIPTLWPNVLNVESKVDSDMAKNILPIPCDQRYDKEDMKIIVSALLAFLGQKQ